MSANIFFENENESFLSFLGEKKYNRIIVLVDAKSNGFCLPVLKEIFPVFKNTEYIVIPDGEKNKNINTCNIIWKQLSDLKVNRHSLLINLGGGMVSDIGGFCSSVFKRGIDFMNIPTTLLAMTDACYGGKTGIDFENAKNNIGTFRHPLAVYINSIFLKTLPEHILKSGIAEMMKHSLLTSQVDYDKKVQYDEAQFYNIEAIQESILIKRKIADADEFDNGIRQILNLGHTIGHALESYSLSCSKPLLHGEAVLLGLIYELELSHQLFAFDEKNIESLIEFKNRIFPNLFLSFQYTDIEKYLLGDKKNADGIMMSLLPKAGECKWQVSVTKTQIQESIRKANERMK